VTTQQRPRQPTHHVADVIDELPLAQRHLSSNGRHFRFPTTSADVRPDDVRRQYGADIRLPLELGDVDVDEGGVEGRTGCYHVLVLPSDARRP